MPIPFQILVTDSAGSGNVDPIAEGAVGEVLTSNGPGVVPSWEPVGSAIAPELIHPFLLMGA